jgi:hypothetical protein
MHLSKAPELIGAPRKAAMTLCGHPGPVGIDAETIQKWMDSKNKPSLKKLGCPQCRRNISLLVAAQRGWILYLTEPRKE